MSPKNRCSLRYVQKSISGRGELKIQGEERSSRYLEIVRNPPYECLNVLLKRTSILRGNQRESWLNLCKELRNYEISKFVKKYTRLRFVFLTPLGVWKSEESVD